MSDILASQSTHWYRKDGSPCYTVIGKNGKERPATLRDARQLDLLPSVTAICKVAAAPGLEQWKLNQVLASALTLPRIEGENEQDFSKRVIEDSREQGKKAAEKGTELHTAIERYAQGLDYDSQFQRHIEVVETVMDDLGLPIRDGKAEKTFAHTLGFAGKSDWSSPAGIVDFKSKKAIPDPSARLAYAEHRIQLGSYREGLALGKTPGWNIFVGIDDCGIAVHRWEPDELEEGFEMFKCLLKFWQLSCGYQP